MSTLLAKIDGEPRRGLLFHLLDRSADVQPLRAALRMLLLSEDPEDAEFLFELSLSRHEFAGLDELLRETFPAVRSGPMRAAIDQHLGLPGEAQRCWQDTK